MDAGFAIDLFHRTRRRTKSDLPAGPGIETRHSTARGQDDRRVRIHTRSETHGLCAAVYGDAAEIYSVEISNGTASTPRRLTSVTKLKERVTAQFRAEFFNVLNHTNISNPFGGPGGDNSFTDPSATGGASFGFRPQTPDVTSSNPVLGSGGPRAIQLGLKIIF